MDDDPEKPASVPLEGTAVLDIATGVNSPEPAADERDDTINDEESTDVRTPLMIKEESMPSDELKTEREVSSLLNAVCDKNIPLSEPTDLRKDQEDASYSAETPVNQLSASEKDTTTKDALEAGPPVPRGDDEDSRSTVETPDNMSAPSEMDETSQDPEDGAQLLLSDDGQEAATEAPRTPNFECVLLPNNSDTDHVEAEVDPTQLVDTLESGEVRVKEEVFSDSEMADSQVNPIQFCEAGLEGHKVELVPSLDSLYLGSSDTSCPQSSSSLQVYEVTQGGKKFLIKSTGKNAPTMETMQKWITLAQSSLPKVKAPSAKPSKDSEKKSSYSMRTRSSSGKFLSINDVGVDRAKYDLRRSKPGPKSSKIATGFGLGVLNDYLDVGSADIPVKYTFDCRSCWKILSNWQFHNTVCHSLKCPICTTKAFGVKELEHHLECKHPEFRPKVMVEKLMENYFHESNPLRCSICQFIASSYRALIAHVSDHFSLTKNLGMLSCKMCDYSTLEQSDVLTHVSTHFDRHTLITCQLCDAEFNSRFARNRHLESFHSITNLNGVSSESEFVCDVCMRRVSSLSDLQLHKLAMHTDEEQPTDRRSLARVAAQRKYACKVCNVILFSRSEAETHMFQTHCFESDEAETRFWCSKCDFSTFSYPDLQQHTITHDLFPFTCEVCGTNVLTKDQLRAHMATHPIDNHDSPTREHHPLPVEVCLNEPPMNEQNDLAFDDDYRDENSIEEDAASDGFGDFNSSGNAGEAEFGGQDDEFGEVIGGEVKISKNSCNLCNVKFNNIHKLYEHAEANHSDIWFEIRARKRGPPNGPFRCEGCKMRFPNRYQLEAHRLRHRDIKRFLCESCGNSFADHRAANIHSRRAHRGNKLLKPRLNLNLKSYRISELFCNFCKIEFHDFEALFDHCINSHPVEQEVVRPRGHFIKNPFQDGMFHCEECGVSRAKLHAVHKHRLVHRNIRRYSCLDCSLCFKDRRTLWRHCVKAHGKGYLTPEEAGRFTCNICKDTFSTLKVLKRHLVKHGKISSPDGKMPDRRAKKRPATRENSRSFSNNTPEVASPPKKAKIKSEEDSYYAENSSQVADFDSEMDYSYDYEQNDDSQSQEIIEGSHPISKFSCNWCGRRFADIHELFKHAEMKHQEIRVNVFHRGKDYGSGPMQCDECPLKFNQVYFLKEHKLRHRGVKRFRCDNCFAAFVSHRSVRDHVSQKSCQATSIPVSAEAPPPQTSNQRKSEAAAENPAPEEGPLLSSQYDISEFYCNVCDYAFQDFDELYNHVYRAHLTLNHKLKYVENSRQSYLYNCDECHRSFETMLDLQGHKLRHRGIKRFRCGQCFKTFVHQKSIVAHCKAGYCEYPSDDEAGSSNDADDSEWTDVDEKDEASEVSNGNQVSQAVSEYINYRRSSEFKQGDPRFSHSMCNICRIEFKNLHHLYSHAEKTHSDIHCNIITRSFGRKRAHACDECGVSFAQTHFLKIHKLRHRGIRAFACRLCPKTFIDKKSTLTHIERDHSDQRTPVKKNRKPHIHLKFVVTPFGMIENYCNLCGCSYANIEDLYAHSEEFHKHLWVRLKNEGRYIQESKGPFSCAKCGMRLKTPFHVKNHMLRHRNIKSFYCPKCPKAFNARKIAYSHCIKYHNDGNSCSLPNTDRFECELCKGVFTEKSKLDRHVKKHVRYGLSLPSAPVPDDEAPHRDYNNEYGTYNSESPIIDYYCNLCPYEFKNVQQLVRHSEEMHRKPEEPDFISYEMCHFCGKTLVGDRLLEHILCHRNIYPFFCQLCNTSFRTRKAAANHCQQAHSITVPGCTLVLCEICQASFSTLARLDIHLEQHRRGEIPLPPSVLEKSSPLKREPELSPNYTETPTSAPNFHHASQKSDSISSSLRSSSRRHQQASITPPEIQGSVGGPSAVVHKRRRLTTNMTEGTFSCKVCNQTFNKVIQLFRHKLIHRQLYTCNECGTPVLGKRALVSHLQYHFFLYYFCRHCNQSYNKLGEYRKHLCKDQDGRTFQCFRCPRTFNKSYLLKAHRAKHKQNLNCSECGITLACMSTYKTHMKIFHMPRKFLCPECGEMFGLEHQLRRHLERHKDLKHECPHCPQRFYHLQDLHNHKNLKHKLQCYICPICGRALGSKQTYQIHVDRHTRKKTETCQFCGRQYAELNGLRYHLKTVHNWVRPG